MKAKPGKRRMTAFGIMTCVSERPAREIVMVGVSRGQAEGLARMGGLVCGGCNKIQWADILKHMEKCPAFKRKAKR